MFLCNATLLRKIIKEWHVAAHESREEKLAVANQEWFSAMMSKADEDRELRDMQESDDELKQFYAMEKKLQEEKEEKEYWEYERKVAQNNLTEKLQEKERLLAKEKKLEKKLEHDHETWKVCVCLVFCLSSTIYFFSRFIIILFFVPFPLLVNFFPQTFSTTTTTTTTEPQALAEKGTSRVTQEAMKWLTTPMGNYFLLYYNN